MTEYLDSSPCPQTPASFSDEFITGLNPAQREAVLQPSGPLLVLAGAGSGKTRLITHRIAHLIAGGYARPTDILAVTFTNKAAGEMRERVEQLLAGRDSATGVVLSTFHSFCVRVLRAHITELGRGWTGSFSITDQDDSTRVIKSILKEMGEDDKQAPKAVQSLISGAKNRGENPETYYLSQRKSGRYEQLAAQVFPRYERALLVSNALDFDDLLLRTVELFRSSEKWRSRYHHRFCHVLVDEYQDTNKIQYELIRLLAAGDLALADEPFPSDIWDRRSLCCVGDDFQAIYSFRAADFRIMLGFARDFTGARTIKLEANYRSTEQIVGAANALIAHNKTRLEKTLVSVAGPGSQINHALLEDGEEEARFAAAKISEHIRREPGLKAAILYRTNFLSRAFEEALRRAGLKYQIVGGLGFYERAEIKDIVAYLKLLRNEDDSLALARIINTPARGIGDATLEKLEVTARECGISTWEAVCLALQERTLPKRALTALESFKALIERLRREANHEGVPLPDLIRTVITETGYEASLIKDKSEEAFNRRQNLGELVSAAAAEQGERLDDFLDHAALVSDQDELEGETSPVTLMTIHASKGLEFPLVFVVGLEENLLPHSRSLGAEEEIEEERRLCYVALTRAQKYLYLTEVKERRLYGGCNLSETSRFIKEIPKDLVDANQRLRPAA